MVRRLDVSATSSIRVKAILTPSGDQAGSVPSASRMRPVPVAFILQMPPSAANASLLPSGDQFGPYSAEPGVFVRFASPVPSGFIVKSSPPREKAILLPSGDHAGSPESDAALVSGMRSVPSESIL